MRETAFIEAIKQICENDPRYDMEAYIFIREGLDHTIKVLQKPEKGPQRHVSGQELMEGIRQYALQEFGPMAFKVLTSWGIAKTEDFGEIVFNLVQSGELGKTDEDRREDFKDGYDFHDAFAKPFLPETPLALDTEDSPATPGRRT
jgi:uncharacterized repeat protein (TIGR04138 family)